MKKSEMINSLELKLKSLYGYDRISKEDLNTILSAIEELGMLPPTAFIEHPFDGFSKGIMKNEWECEWESPIEQSYAYLINISKKEMIENMENDLNNPNLWNKDGTTREEE